MKILAANFLNILHHLSKYSRTPMVWLLNELGLAPEEIANLNDYVPWSYCRQALLLSVQHTGKPFFGLVIGATAHPLVAGPELGMCLQVCPDFRTMVEVFSLYSPLLGNAGCFQYQERKGESVLYFKGLSAWKADCAVSYRTGMEIYAASIVSVSRQLTQNGVRILRLEFDYPKSREMEQAYRGSFGEQIKIEFGHSQCAVVFSVESMQIKNPYYEASLYHQIRSNLEMRLRRQQQDFPIQECIKSLLEEQYFQPRLPEMQIEQVAEHLNQTVRHLQRELQAESCSFRGLRNEVKTELANRYLSYKSNQELADLLKFADVTAFSRWFKSQFLLPPNQLRQHRKMVGKPLPA